MRKIKRALIVILAVVIILPIASCGVRETWFEFRYQSKANDYLSKMYYDDSLFEGPSDVYDPSLATASLSFAMASFGSMLESDYAKKSCNAYDLLTKIGFGEIEANEFFKEKPDTDSLGCVFGKKKIDGKTMIACGIRGSNYGAEWASNITVGADTADGYHKGFYEGSEIFLESLKQYVADKNISGGVMLWIVGYSRAGAVANISSGRIDEAIRDGVKLLGENVTVAKDDLFAYCFEPPQGVRYDETLYPKSETFNNIFCIVNFNDAVTRVAMSEWSFTRYGVDKILFDNLNDIDYLADIEKMTAFFDGYENSSLLGKYSVPDFEMKGFSEMKLTASSDYINWAQGLYLDGLLSQIALYGLESRELYTEDIQTGLRDILRYAYKESSPSESIFDLALSLADSILSTESISLLFDDLLHELTKLRSDAKDLLKNAFKSLDVDLDAGSVTEAVDGIIAAIIKTFLHDFELSLVLPMFSKLNITCIAQAHQPELTLAFLRSLDPKYTDDPVGYDMSGRYYYIMIDDDDADVTVLYNGNEIAKFEDGKPVDVASAVPYGNHKGLCIYLPFGCEYTLVSSTDEIEISYYDPAKLAFVDCGLAPTETDDICTITIPGEK